MLTKQTISQLWCSLSVIIIIIISGLRTKEIVQYVGHVKITAIKLKMSN